MHRVLIFSQMTRVLDVLEDYCCDRMRNYKYCRIDGSTDGELRDAQIEEFNKPGSDKFIFLLSTRAGGLGINLATADTVILYDSDWNPQADLQAMDRAHRIGQKRPVNVYRLISEKTLEERILRKAMEKLHLDSLVIQSGRLADQKKNLQKDDLLDMIRYGADSFFKVNADSYEEIDLDLILSRGEEKTKAMNAEIQKELPKVNPTDFKLTGEVGSIHQYEGVNYREERNNTLASDKYFLDVGKRGRQKPDDGAYTRDSGRVVTVQRPKQRLKPPKEPTINDFQFCDGKRLRELYEEEKAVIDKFNAECEEAAKEGREEPAPPEHTLSPEKVEERKRLLENGFPDWLKRDFNLFLRACERHGRNDLDAICSDMADAKPEDEVRRYHEIFWSRGPDELESWDRIENSIKEGEARIVRRKEIEKSIRMKVDRYEDAMRDMDIPYAGNKGRQFVEEEDRWLICSVAKMGYGRWDELKAEARRAPDFKFNWFIKSRTPVELKRRFDILVRVIEKENTEILAAERAAARKRSLSSTRKRLSEGDGNALAKLKSPKSETKPKSSPKKGPRDALKETKSPMRKKPGPKPKNRGGARESPRALTKKPSGNKPGPKKRVSGPMDNLLTPKKKKAKVVQ